MNLKVEQYLALSSLAYQVIPNSLLDNVSKQTLEEIVSHLTARTNLLELKPLSSLASWHLINATPTSSGMSAIAVQIQPPRTLSLPTAGQILIRISGKR